MKIFLIIITLHDDEMKVVTQQEKASASGSCDLCLCTQLLAHTLLLYHNQDLHHVNNHDDHDGKMPF